MPGAPVQQLWDAYLDRAAAPLALMAFREMEAFTQMSGSPAEASVEHPPGLPQSRGYLWVSSLALGSDRAFVCERAGERRCIGCAPASDGAGASRKLRHVIFVAPFECAACGFGFCDLMLSMDTCLQFSWAPFLVS